MTINLLAWRQQQYKRNKLIFSAQLLILPIFILLLLITWRFWLLKQINVQAQQLQYWQQKVIELDGQYKLIIEKQKQYQSLMQQQQLESGKLVKQKHFIRLLLDLPKIMPSTIYLTSIQLIGTRLVIIGIAAEQSQIINLLKQLIPYGKTSLIETKSNNQQTSLDFQISIELN